MCGIAGKMYADRERQVDDELLRRMCRALVHRGPDDEGRFVHQHVGLCMRRLQVIDLSGGHQPMANEEETVWIVFNGEIYNYQELRADLESRGHHFRTASDTEVILHLYEEKGVDCLAELRGMFAIALYDRRVDELLLARDRLGKKPLYYALAASALTFASELGALTVDEEVDRSVDPAAVDEYLSCLFIPHPRTIYKGVRKLAPGSYAVFAKGKMRTERYWQVRYDSVKSNMDENEVVEALDDELREAVRLRLLADVPLGAFLSGGLDSSLIVALMQEVSGRQVKTFSIGFDDSSFNELNHARQVAQHLGSDHREDTVSYRAAELIPGLLDHFGEPFADSSALPTYHLSKFTRNEVTVALSGDGGDEVFGGYRRYKARLLADLYNRWPGYMGRGLLESASGRMREPSSYYGTSYRKKIKRFVEFAGAARAAPETSWAFFFTQREKSDLYAEYFADTLSEDTEQGSLAPYADEQAHAGQQAMMWFDLMTYLPDDILVKVDRMSMACSLEARAPLLDHKVVEFMAGVPRSLKFGVRRSKYLLRKVAARYLPESILSRPKQGFAIPLSGWLQGDLREWMQEILLSSNFRSRGYFKPEAVANMIEAHLRGRRDYSQQLWALLVLELWFDRVTR